VVGEPDNNLKIGLIVKEKTRFVTGLVYAVLFRSPFPFPFPSASLACSTEADMCITHRPWSSLHF
jgi:hypothetical protein